jgi:hypothetical protein
MCFYNRQSFFNKHSNVLLIYYSYNYCYSQVYDLNGLNYGFIYNYGPDLSCGSDSGYNNINGL